MYYMSYKKIINLLSLLNSNQHKNSFELKELIQPQPHTKIQIHLNRKENNILIAFILIFNNDYNKKIFYW